MRVSFKPTEGARLNCSVPFDGCAFVTAPGRCPACGIQEEQDGRFNLQGVPGAMRKTHDEYIAPARCVACQANIGEITLKVNTIFGIEEDERVLGGQARVY